MSDPKPRNADSGQLTSLDAMVREAVSKGIHLCYQLRLLDWRDRPRGDILSEVRSLEGALLTLASGVLNPPKASGTGLSPPVPINMSVASDKPRPASTSLDAPLAPSVQEALDRSVEKALMEKGPQILKAILSDSPLPADTEVIPSRPVSLQSDPVPSNPTLSNPILSNGEVRIGKVRVDRDLLERVVSLLELMMTKQVGYLLPKGMMDEVRKVGIGIVSTLQEPGKENP